MMGIVIGIASSSISSTDKPVLIIESKPSIAAELGATGRKHIGEFIRYVRCAR